MIGLDVNWNFKDVQNNVETIKTQFEGILSSFLWNKLKERGMALHRMKQEIFEYKNILYWQRERLWEVMNGDFDINKFKELCK